ncbi:MAG: hypothetical protein AB7O24_00420 [Kofleriaceae bacterium]
MVLKPAGLCLLVGVGLGACVGEAPLPDTNMNPEDVVLCRAVFKVTGAVTEAPPRPIDEESGQPITGCWGKGVWTFTAELNAEETAAEDPACTGSDLPEQLAAEYKFRVTEVDADDGSGKAETYEWLGDQAMLYRLKVSEGGGGECEGGVQLYRDDNRGYYNFKPALTGATIDGFGEYALYEIPQMRECDGC